MKSDHVKWERDGHYFKFNEKPLYASSHSFYNISVRTISFLLFVIFTSQPALFLPEKMAFSDWCLLVRSRRVMLTLYGDLPVIMCIASIWREETRNGQSCFYSNLRSILRSLLP